jgi:ribonuclease HII
VCKGELNALEREVAVRLIEKAPSCDKIIADGKRMFSALATRFEGFTSMDRAEEHHASVAAASVVAKVLRDERFNAIRARYEPELGPITGGGYGNAATQKWVRAYVEKYGKLPEDARLLRFKCPTAGVHRAAAGVLGGAGSASDEGRTV